MSGTRCGAEMYVFALHEPQLESIFSTFVSFEFSRDRLSCERLNVDILCLLGFHYVSPVPIQLRASVHARQLPRRLKNASKYGENLLERATTQRLHQTGACQFKVPVKDTLAHSHTEITLRHRNHAHTRRHPRTRTYALQRAHAHHTRTPHH